MGYAVIVDAGSSGSRVYVYSWALDASAGPGNSLPRLETRPAWVHKITPGISTFANDDADASQIWKEHLRVLVATAERAVPATERPSTPFYFLATAGLRLVPEAQRTRVLDTVCSLLRERTSFHLPECDTHVTMIDGQTEGLYGWLALNYLVHTRDDKPWISDDFETTYGFMDMGGASAQIAFVPNKTESERHANDLYSVNLRTLDGRAVDWHVFVSTWLGFGANEAQKRYRALLLDNLTPADLEPVASGAEVLVPDPCLPFQAMDHTSASLGRPDGLDSEVIFVGNGQFGDCISKMEPLLNDKVPCKDEPCLFDGVHVPAFDLASQKFVGVSEYWYTAEDIYKLSGKFDYATFISRAMDFCDDKWSDIEANLNAGLYGSMPRSGLMNSCLKSAWVLTILHKGFNFPLTPKDPVAHHNFLDTFQSAAHVDDKEISWTLGRAVLYASSKVAPAADNNEEVGFTSDSGLHVIGGEVAHNDMPLAPGELPSVAPLPVSGTPDSYTTRGITVPVLAILALLCVVAAVYLRGSRHSVTLVPARLRRSVRGLMSPWRYEPVLPTQEGSIPNSPALSANQFPLHDLVGSSTSAKPPSNVPSRVSSRMNMREDW